MRTHALLLVAALGLGACGTGAEETLGQVDKAETIALEGALRNAATAEESVRAQTGSYASDVAQLKNNGMTLDPTITITVGTASPTAYCLQATKQGSDETWHLNSGEGSPSAGAC